MRCQHASSERGASRVLSHISREGGTPHRDCILGRIPPCFHQTVSSVRAARRLQGWKRSGQQLPPNRRRARGVPRQNCAAAGVRSLTELPSLVKVRVLPLLGHGVRVHLLSSNRLYYVTELSAMMCIVLVHAEMTARSRVHAVTPQAPPGQFPGSPHAEELTSDDRNPNNRCV